MSTTARRALTVVLALAGVALPITAAAAPTAPPAAPAAAVCSAAWGSLPESVAVGGTATVRSVRTGAHECFDRVVFTLAGPAAGYHVEYVDTIYQDGSGFVLPTPGGARLQVLLHHPAYDEDGNTTIVPSPTVGRPLADVRGYRSLRSVMHGGTFEGDTTVGIGTRTRLPFRVFTLDGPGAGSRIVIDVAHGW